MGVGIFHAKTGEQNFRVPIRLIVPVLIRVEKQIGGLQNKNTSAANGEAGCQVKAIDKGFCLPVSAFFIGRGENCDLVRALGPVGWRGRDTVPFGSKKLILGYGLQANRVGVLKIFKNPQAAFFIE